jgi:glycosyltransferase involved in cell wall biosynthesis
MTDKLISVIIPSYNCSIYLKDAIESVLNQQQVNTEIIVVNDGSTDNTEEILKPYQIKIKYIKQGNRGLSSARNVGFRMSHGEFVCFLDADDILLENKFKIQLDRFREDSSLGVVISGYINVEEDGQKEISRVNKYWDHDALKHLFNHEVFPPHTALIRHSVLEESQLFPEKIDVNESQEDWQLWFDLALNGVEFASIPEPTCKYRSRPGSIRKNPLKHLDGALRVINWLHQHPKAKLYPKEIERLSAIIELERIARSWQMNKLTMTANILTDSVRKFPFFWKEPDNIIRLFKKTLTLHEEEKWNKSPDSIWFENCVIKGIIPLGKDLLKKAKIKQLYAVSYLALSDLVYGQNANKTRLCAIASAFNNSPIVCLSKEGVKSFVRGILGPLIGKMLNRYKRKKVIPINL